MATTIKDRKPFKKKRQWNSQYHTEGGDEDDDHEAEYDDDDWEHADNIEYEEEEYDEPTEDEIEFMLSRFLQENQFGWDITGVSFTRS